MDKYSLECCEEHLAMNMGKQRQPVKGETMRDGKKERGMSEGREGGRKGWTKELCLVSS